GKDFIVTVEYELSNVPVPPAPELRVEPTRKRGAVIRDQALGASYKVTYPPGKTGTFDGQTVSTKRERRYGIVLGVEGAECHLPFSINGLNLAAGMKYTYQFMICYPDSQMYTTALKEKVWRWRVMKGSELKRVKAEAFGNRKKNQLSNDPGGDMQMRYASFKKGKRHHFNAQNNVRVFAAQTLNEAHVNFTPIPGIGAYMVVLNVYLHQPMTKRRILTHASGKPLLKGGKPLKETIAAVKSAYYLVRVTLDTTLHKMLKAYEGLTGSVDWVDPESRALLISMLQSLQSKRFQCEVIWTKQKRDFKSADPLPDVTETIILLESLITGNQKALKPHRVGKMKRTEFTDKVAQASRQLMKVITNP
ncbi:MAG: hypothetical protein Q7S65_02125, partial [Nanoarchaeota archaeon]|nr:hypothetical protein [Nanoarchaeota archaeon]